MVVGGLDVTDAYIRARQVDPSEFERSSLRTIRLTSGVKAIVGKKKGESTQTIQSILFDKKKFTEEQAKDWLAAHKTKFSDALDYEERKASLFSHTLADHCIGHLPPLTPTQLKRLMEVAGEPDPSEIEAPEDEEPVEDYTAKFAKRI